MALTEILGCMAMAASADGVSGRGRPGSLAGSGPTASRARPSAPASSWDPPPGPVVAHVQGQGPKQIFLVREIQIEGPVRRLGGLDDVVDSGRLVAPLAQHVHPRIEQPLHRALAPGPQGPVPGGPTLSRPGAVSVR